MGFFIGYVSELDGDAAGGVSFAGFQWAAL